MGRVATALFDQAKSHGARVVVDRVVKDIDAMVRALRFDGWQQPSASECMFTESLRFLLLKCRMHGDLELFSNAATYIRKNY